MTKETDIIIYNTDVSMHISNILNENELDKNSVIKDYLTTAADGKNYNVTFYSLEMILAVAFRVRSRRGTQFRKWANRTLKEYLQKGFIMDDERLKNPNGRFDYFNELLARIRDISASEMRFYQKVRELFWQTNRLPTSSTSTVFSLEQAQLWCFWE